MKFSEYPTGTHIMHDFDEYIKTERFWKPMDDMANHLTFRELDHFQDRGDKIEILALPWVVVQALIESVKYWQKAANGVNSEDWLILNNAIDSLTEEDKDEES
jgi:hypothetical protein